MEIKIFAGFGHILLEVGFALLPLLGFFLFFQIFILRLPWPQLLNILKGLVPTFLGLALFLQGVKVGFFPVGSEMGAILAGMHHNWLLIPIGFVLGFVATFAEPAVRILNLEVEKTSSGSIPQSIMLYTLSLGVGLSIAISMARMLLGIPLWYLIIPGYLLAMLLMRYSSKTFTSIAFDSGGVATGPMTVTFIMAVSVGAAGVMEGRNPLLDGFGMITLVALAPILAVLILGLLFNRRRREQA
ncbi:DUF1538 domain-containing protein [Desulfurivibrio alkaliphilus]|uniref:DUF1538 domain-containing protein n=1 Tax=Desulfurivibrio alkaliphilus (strain DSM 19089 / UNIQEM U267 / AHT2) TaxID=589865 RepID=D6Z542_DESAT|nr:DUF1538 domain-containing protein [Desulfurivibrio alkaliphilus]ADH86667.1 protein of unknown function DUF1538 [Desulfurivibrio alkaliphilus AHT 2]